ncbi:sugar ABC transporter substrate-binding protein [Acidisoma silvae]|uniref:Sugar ABC transporter substrate-binding protein n=1 Tax=Acidisoma silvae TaxID=2802396 RepID=A0A964E1F0_9PROT|nr:sugar ABC transporter substrate-binding protein [Acidisoma silvae]MCB8878505.1 sugar ABC transporter substrate-binding protein [Acidisoma silvae]
MSREFSTPSPYSRRHFLRNAGIGTALMGGAAFNPVLSSTASAASESYKVAPLHQLLLLSNEWCTIINDAALRAAKVLGLPYQSTTFNLNDSLALTQAQSAAAAGAKLFLTNSMDGSSLGPIAKTAHSLGGYLVNVGTDIPWTSPLDYGPGFSQDFHPREDIGFYGAVRETVRQAVAKFGDKATFFHITGPTGTFADDLRSAAVNHAVSEFPGVKIIGSLPGNWNAGDGQKATEDLISRLGVPNGIIAQNDGSLTGVLAALRGLGIKAGDKVLTCGVDGSTDILRAIKSGRVTATAFQSPAYHGIQAVAHLFDALNGYQFTTPERFVGFAGIVVTKDNVEGVLKRYVDNPNLPFDPRLLSHVISGDNWDPQAPLVPIKYEEYFGVVPKPAGYKPPAAYVASIKSGEFDRVTRQYEAAYKLKLEDFDYPGVKV